MFCEDVYTLQSLNGTKEKCNFIRSCAYDKDFKLFLYYALNPLLTYNISEKTLRRSDVDKDCCVPSEISSFTDIFDCCEFLSSLQGINNTHIRQVKLFLDTLSDNEKELYIKLLSKTLRLGVTAKTVNKVIPNLIPEWEVQQAYTLEKYPIKSGTKFWLTQKLNGVRATFYNGQLIARSGIPYSGVDHIISELSKLDNMGLVFDGELTLKETTSLSENEAFRIATGILNSDATDKSEILYTIFDAIPKCDFESESPTITYSSRRKILDNLQQQEVFTQDGFVKILPVLYCGEDDEMIDTLLDQMTKEDKEGLMLNTDVPYRRTRHRGILKIKRFYTMDLPILRCEEGTGRLSGTLGAIVLQYKNNEVKVGSGFTDQQRMELWRSREQIIGSLCEVKYKEISKDKDTGLESLQFPVFVSMRYDKNDVSYG